MKPIEVEELERGCNIELRDGRVGRFQDWYMNFDNKVQAIISLLDKGEDCGHDEHFYPNQIKKSWKYHG